MPCRSGSPQGVRGAEYGFGAGEAVWPTTETTPIPISVAVVSDRTRELRMPFFVFFASFALFVV
jgi:hypothetical protein